MKLVFLLMAANLSLIKKWLHTTRYFVYQLSSNREKTPPFILGFMNTGWSFHRGLCFTRAK
jgi:hypothetical protein